MALINGIYVFVQDESVEDGVSATTHPVEKGIPLTDHVQRNPVKISITGELVGENAADTLSKMKKICHTGTLVKYTGRNYIKNALLLKFDTGHPNTVWGGCTFTAEIQEVRIAKSPYNASSGNGGTQQVENNSTTTKVYHTIKKGDTVWGLVAASNAPYKNLKREGAGSGTTNACNWVMKNNPHAFSRYGDFRTGQIGKRLYVGDKVK